MTKETGSLLKWWHKVDVPSVQALTAEGFIFAELFWPGLVGHRRQTAIGECEDGRFRFEGATALGSDVRIVRENPETEVGKIKITLGKPSVIILSDGHSYTLQNEGFLREDWVLVDENSEPLFRVKRVYIAVEDSGEVVILGEGLTRPPMLLLMMAAWYIVR